MGISFLNESNSSKFQSASAAIEKLRLSTWRGNKILYRSLAAAAILACIICSAVLSAGQEGAPEITSLEKRAVGKKDPGPRAIGLLQMSSSGKVTMLPIAIMIDGKFYDASSYKASPIPMALDGGTIYEGERSGSSVGLFTVNGALHSTAVNAVNPWLATGTWLPAGSGATKGSQKAEITPVGIETTDEPPRLTKNGSAAKASSPVPETSAPPAPAQAPVPSTGSTGPSTTVPNSTTTPPTSTTPSTTPASAPNTGSGSTSSAPPVSTTGSGSSGSGTPASGTAAPSASQSAQDTKTPAAASNAKPAEPAKSQTAAQADDQPSDPNRPRLRRGKPTQAIPDEDIPGYAKLGSNGKARTSSDTAKTPGTSGATVKMDTIDLVPAISDAHGPDPRPYTFEWGKVEVEDRRKQMLDLAKEQLRAYLQAQAKQTTTPKPTAATQATRRPTPKLPQPVVENVRWRTFDVWTNNQPIMILSADAHLPPSKTWTSGDANPEPMQYSVLLVARTDIYNNLHKMYAGITDKFHLDVTPRLDLIDVVDADGDGSGELFFKETSDIGSGYVIYRPTADSLWKMFDSLNPE